MRTTEFNRILKVRAILSSTIMSHRGSKRDAGSSAAAAGEAARSKRLRTDETQPVVASSSHVADLEESLAALEEERAHDKAKLDFLGEKVMMPQAALAESSNNLHKVNIDLQNAVKMDL